MTTQTLAFTHETPQDGHTNMARDRELLEQAEHGQASCRVYSWTGPWISLGCYQDPQRDLLTDQVPHVMRPTGGKAVLHGHDVTIGLALHLNNIPSSTPLSARSLKAVYRAIAEPIINALQECQVPAALGEHTRFVGKGPKTADCFAHVSPNDIVDQNTGVKVCGCALKLTQTAVLLQASIPNGRPLVDPATLFQTPQPSIYTTWDSQSFPATLQAKLEEWLRGNLRTPTSSSE